MVQRLADTVDEFELDCKSSQTSRGCCFVLALRPRLRLRPTCVGLIEPLRSQYLVTCTLGIEARVASQERHGEAGPAPTSLSATGSNLSGQGFVAGVSPVLSSE